MWKYCIYVNSCKITTNVIIYNLSIICILYDADLRGIGCVCTCDVIFHEKRVLIYNQRICEKQVFLQDSVSDFIDTCTYRLSKK